MRGTRGGGAVVAAAAAAGRLCAAAACLLPVAAWAAVALDMEIRQVRETGDAQNPKRQETVAEVRVALGGAWSESSGEGRREIHDYATRRIYDVDTGRGTVDDRSLFAPVAFRVMETANRRMIREVMAKARLGAATSEAEQQLATEHELSLRESRLKGGSGGPDLAVRDEADGRHWGDGRRDLAVASREGFPLPEKDRAAYGRWLRNAHSLHPDVVAALLAGGQVPARLEARYFNLDAPRGALTLTVRGLRALPDDAVPAPYGRSRSVGEGAPGAPGLEALLARVSGEPADGFQERRRQVERMAAEALNGGRIRDGVAAVLAASIITGDGGLGGALAGHREQIAGDPAAAALMAAIGTVPRDRAAARAQADRLREARAAIPTPALKAVEANLRQAAGEVRDAEALLFEALEADPYLIGAWMDLGRLYYGQYRTVQAWRCWDAARRLAPGHPMTRDIDDLEKRLVSGFPEFF